MIRALTLLALAGLAAASAAGQSLGAKPLPASSPVRVTALVNGPAWNSLSLAHQAALAPLKAHWNDIDAPRRQKWVEVAQRFPSMPLEERQRVQARMAEWATMSPTDRGRARQNFQELRNLPTEDRHARWEAYKALPPEQRQELATRALPPNGKPNDGKAGTPKGPEGKAVDVKAADNSNQAQAGKRKVAVNPTAVVIKPVTPTVVQAKPGASTTLVTRSPAPPVHHQPGLPKITASAGFVNPTTLLPSRGPQGAAVVLPAASATSGRPGSGASASSPDTPSGAGSLSSASAPVATSSGASAP